MSTASDAASGLLVLDKPAGMTSHDVVGRVRLALGLRRVGHAGTLDPDATGVLVLGVNRATRLLQFLSGLDKEYRGTVRFGVTTDTLDASGAVLDRQAMPALDRRRLEAAVRDFTGDILQVPPMVSAIKIGGEALHAKARRGEEVERAPRKVHISELAVEGFASGPYPEAVIRVRCSAGTYIRSLAADLGVALGGQAHLADLRRLAVGGYTLSEAVPLAGFEAGPEPWACVLPPVEALRGLASVEVDDERARAVAHGAVFAASALTGSAVHEPVAVLHRGHLIAVYGPHSRGSKPIVVL